MAEGARIITADIDIGGTFTDGFFTDGTRVEKAKVDTTPHDLTVCFFACLREGAERFGHPDLRGFLKRVSIVRWSTTVGSNTLFQRTGPKIGLLVTKNHEKDLYGKGTSKAIGYLVGEEVVGLQAGGALEESEALAAIRNLLERGVRRVVISLKGAYSRPENERQVAALIKEHFPEHYLGYVPTLQGSEICQVPDDMTRTHFALLNTYIHPNVASCLYKAEDGLRDNGFDRPLLTVHTNGGVVRVAKTRAADTIESGPVAGVFCSSHLARLYALENVLTLDIGGTTAKVAAVSRGRVAYTMEPEIVGIPLKLPMVEVASIGVGGCSVVTPDPKKRSVSVGPRSMGAYPGPACYDTGGDQATPTDAYVVLGYIDPRYFLGGRRALNADRARAVIQERLAGPLKNSLEGASWAVLKELAHVCEAEMVRGAEGRGIKSSQCAMFAYGGAGPLSACLTAEEAGIDQIYVFPFGSEFSAFGSSIMEVLHFYGRSQRLPMMAKGSVVADLQAFNGAVAVLKDAALRDMKAEGFEAGAVSFQLELEAGDGPKAVVFPSPCLEIGSERDVRSVCDAYFKESASPANGVTITALRLRASASVPRYQLISRPLGGADASAAIKGERSVFWGEGFLPTRIYEWDRLSPGNSLDGPAVVEGTDTTYGVRPRWRLSIDEYGNGLLTREGR